LARQTGPVTDVTLAATSGGGTALEPLGSLAYCHRNLSASPSLWQWSCLEMAATQ
jgi:hypothetical protein